MRLVGESDEAEARRIADSYLSPAVTRLFELTLYREDAATPAETVEAHRRILEELSLLEADFDAPLPQEIIDSWYNSKIE